MDSPPTNLSRLDRHWFRNLCELGPRPLVVTGWFLQWLRGHFGTTNNLESNYGFLAHALWKASPTETGITIDSVTRWVDKLVEFKPSVIIKRNAWKRVRLGIDDRMMGTMDPDGQNRYTNLWQGSHTLFCMNRQGAEAELLAAEVFRELNEQGPTVRRILDLMRFEVMEVSEIMKIKVEATEVFAVAVTAGYAYREEWEINEEAPLLKRIDLAAFQP